MKFTKFTPAAFVVIALLIFSTSCNKTELLNPEHVTTTTNPDVTNNFELRANHNADGVFYNALGYNLSGRRIGGPGDVSGIGNTLLVYDVPVVAGVNNIWVAITDFISTSHRRTDWKEVVIQFNPGYSPEQFITYQDVMNAAAAGRITLTTTGAYYTGTIK